MEEKGVNPKLLYQIKKHSARLDDDNSRFCYDKSMIIYKTMTTEEGFVDTLKVFESDDIILEIDAVTHYGKVWILIRRKNKITCEDDKDKMIESLQNISKVSKQYGTTVVFKYMSDISDEIKEIITSFNFMFCSTDVPVSFYVPPVVNVDVNVMITMISDISNGYGDINHANQNVARESREEAENPSIAGIKAVIGNRRMVCCKSGIDKFKSIVLSVGNSREKQRMYEFLGNVEELSDDPSERVIRVGRKDKMSETQINIYGTADKLGFITVSNSRSFISMAERNRISIMFLPIAHSKSLMKHHN